MDLADGLPTLPLARQAGLPGVTQVDPVAEALAGGALLPLGLGAAPLLVEHLDQAEPLGLGQVGQDPGLPSDLPGADLVLALHEEPPLRHAGGLDRPRFEEDHPVLPSRREMDPVPLICFLVGGAVQLVGAVEDDRVEGPVPEGERGEVAARPSLGDLVADQVEAHEGGGPPGIPEDPPAPGGVEGGPVGPEVAQVRTEGDEVGVGGVGVEGLGLRHPNRSLVTWTVGGRFSLWQ